ncbi:MAG: formate C-acetyltransferase [Clostridiaceae bacterium]|nr:formate C-acetyltransferase [Clostridiaceae bacterium]
MQSSQTKVDNPDHESAWAGFCPGAWQESIHVRSFIQANYRPYTGDESFLMPATQRTKDLNRQFEHLKAEEQAKGGVLDIDTSTVSSLLNYPAGYLDRSRELIVGLQTGSPLKRSVNPFGGIRMAEKACQEYGYTLSEKVREQFRYRTTHNDGVFRVYSPEMRAVRHSGLISGLPDAYGRGRLIGDYRRVALYGVDRLIRQKEQDQFDLGRQEQNEENIRLAEELFRQIDFLDKLKQMAALYGYDLSKPARTAREAIQWLYFAYLAAIKEQNGAAMSLGRVSTFLDIYCERDIQAGRLSEPGVQELIDDFVLKLRMARQLRTQDYNELFAGDPLWITESLGGMGEDGRTLVTRSTFRFLHTLENLGPAPEPNLTVLWSDRLPVSFQRYCARLTLETNALQYENDDLMQPRFGDDYAISCCVSAGRIGRDMQFFGARCNLPKLLLLALNGGRDEISGEQIGPAGEPVGAKPLDYEDVLRRFNFYQAWLCRLYVQTMNVIHTMHDKYAYEKIQMALHDTAVRRMMSFGLAGLSVITDSFSAIRYAQVVPVMNEQGLIADFQIKGDFPCFGNDDDRADSLAVQVCESFYHELCQTPCYRGAKHTLSILTITSNVVYGRKTGSTPDGRKRGAPFAPGANPMHGRERSGALAALNSVAKLPFDICRDGISCTTTLTPGVLGRLPETRVLNLITILTGYFSQGAHHLNVNVLDRRQLEDARRHPEQYPNLTIRVSGYAVLFNSLSREQQDEILMRTFHGQL